jgi:hypothetical protein
MAHTHIPDEIPIRYLARPRWWNMLAGVLFLVGAVSFVMALSSDGSRAWQAYIVNWLFFTKVAMGAVAFTAVTYIVKAKWNWSVRRISLSPVSFLPISFLLFLPLLVVMRENYFPWIEEMAHDPILQAKSAWLNIPFLVTRNLLGVAVLFGLALVFARRALRPDMGLAESHEGGHAGRAKWRARLTKGWRGQEAEEVDSHRSLARIAPVLILAYALVMSLLSFDWIMSLDPHWYSTIFGGFFFMGAFWAGIAITARLCVFLKWHDPEIDRMVGSSQLHDLGKLAFAFTVFWGYLFFSQYLPIWYGKLPWEQTFVIERAVAPWGKLSALWIVLCFVIPFAALLGRAPKMRPLWLGAFTGVILAGLWLEMYLFIAPAHYHGGSIFPGWELLVACMFAGLFLLALGWFFSTFPLVQLWQPMVEPEIMGSEFTDRSRSSRVVGGD